VLLFYLVFEGQGEGWWQNISSENEIIFVKQFVCVPGRRGMGGEDGRKWLEVAGTKLCDFAARQGILTFF